MSREVTFTWRKCRACGGSGRKLDGERVVDALFSFGGSLISDAITGERVLSRRCGGCGGSGEVRAISSIREG